MTQLFLDYQDSVKPAPWAGVLVLLLAVVMLLFAGDYYQGMSEKISYWEVKSGQAAKSAGRPSAGSQREMDDMALEIKHANEVLNQITMPWDKLFQAVEWSADKDVALLAMEPDEGKHEVKIRGEAKNIEEVLSYIRHLAEQEIFSSVYLQSHQVQQQNAQRPVRFSLVAAWKVTP
jgi:hypothetical protein